MEHVEAMYDIIDKYIDVEGFRMHPDDDFHKVYEITELDDIELLDKMCHELQLRKPTVEDFDKVKPDFKLLNAESVLSILQNIDQDN